MKCVGRPATPAPRAHARRRHSSASPRCALPGTSSTTSAQAEAPVKSPPSSSNGTHSNGNGAHSSNGIGNTAVPLPTPIQGTPIQLLTVQNGTTAPAKQQNGANGANDAVGSQAKQVASPPNGSTTAVLTKDQMPSGSGKAALLNSAAAKQPASAQHAQQAASLAAEVRPDLYIQLYLALMEEEQHHQQQQQQASSLTAALRPNAAALTVTQTAADVAAEQEVAAHKSALAAAAKAAERAKQAAEAGEAEAAAAAAAQQAKARAAAAAEQAKEAAAAATKAVEAASAAAKQAKEAAEAVKVAELAAAAAAKLAEEMAAAAKLAEQVAAAAKEAEQLAAAAAIATEVSHTVSAAALLGAIAFKQAEQAGEEGAVEEAEDASPELELPQEPYTLVKKVALAGGMLHLIVLEGDRMLRVWTPPGYSRAEAARHPYPLLLLNDGQNLFEDKLSFSGASWRAGEAAAEAITSGRLPPFLVAGIDHAGTERSLEYLPYKPGTGPGGFRKDAASWPGGGVAEYLNRVFDEVLPWVQEQYGAATSPDRIAFGGSSFGGICTLYACMHHGHRFGAALVESPSLWFADEKFLREDLAAYKGPWPKRMFLGMGSREYSSTRPKEPATHKWDRLLVSYAVQLTRLLRGSGMDSSRLQWQIGLQAAHTESAWAQRLPAALDFLLQPWWQDAAQRNAGNLFFTSPSRLTAGQPAVLFVNKAVNHVLAGCTSALRTRMGFNNWGLGLAERELEPAPQLEPGKQRRESQAKQAAAMEDAQGEAVQQDVAGEQQQQAEAQQQQNRGGSFFGSGGSGEASAELAAVAGGEGEAGQQAVNGTAASAAAKGSVPAAASTALETLSQLQSTASAPAPAYVAALEEEEEEATWQAVTFTVPDKAYEMNFVLTDGKGAWDNNGGSDFYLRVKLPPAGPTAGQSPEEVRAAATAAALGPADELAALSAPKLFFTSPEVLVAGAHGVLYFNRARSALRTNPNVKVRMGFNHWDLAPEELPLAPAQLWQGDGVDWWATKPFTVPEDAFDMSFAFTDSQGKWENNEGHNYNVPVWRPRQLEADAPPRTIEHSDAVDHAGGTLHVLRLSKRAGTKQSSRESKWKEEKVLRVWTPPGFSAADAPHGGWPVLFMCDGQNMFEDWLAHQGTAWRVGEAAADLISAEVVPPFVVVAVDSAGPMRSLNYLPYKPGTGAGGFRPDAERWPGGGCEGFMRRLVQEIMPLVCTTFGTSSDPSRVAFGGGSFAGVTALYAALHYPHIFGSVLVESPSLWVAEGRFLGDLWAHKGPLPERIFMGCGTREYSATREFARPEIDNLLQHYYRDAARALEAGGMRGGQRLRFVVQLEAGHHESAWAWRLPEALSFLLSPWWEE